jgi:serine/threonine-protein kinase
LDFGISKLAVEGQGLNSLTRTGTVLGTPQFMAPEQAAGARDQDLRVDLYACGVVLYAILTGQLPYEAENYNLLINEILNKPPKPILTRDPTLDPGLADAVMHSLSRRPEDRYQTAKEMQDALVSWLEANEVEDPSGLLRRVGTAPTVSITGRQTGQRRPSASARAPSGAGASAPRPPSPTVPTRRPSQPRADGPVDDDEPTTSIEVPVEPPSAALRSNTHTPLGWENTPAGVNLPRPKSRAPLVAAAAGAVLLLAGSALAMRLFAPSGWNSVVRSVGLGGLAVGPSPTPPASRTTHAAATGASHSSGASSHSHTPPANTVASTPDAGATSEHGSADAGTSAANSSAHAPEPVHTTAPTHPVHPGGTRNAHPAPHHPAPHHPVHHPAGRTHHR